MPIKAFNVSQYEQVPDEDVTPINYNLSRMVRRNEKTFRTVVAITMGVLFVVGIAFTGYYFLDMSNVKEIEIFETAAGQQFTGGLNTVTIQDLRNTIPSLRNLKFGNNRGEGKFLVGDNSGTARITVDVDTQYQEIIGFGGAFTEASAYNFFKLPPLLQKKVIALYFGEDGINFSLGRIHINSCDFGLESYSFDDKANDYSLKHFDDNVTHDTLQIIPFLREAMAASGLNIRLVASPWSPPAWMKIPNPETGKSSMLGSVTPNGLRNEHRVKYAWAKYISRFVSAYKAKGIDIWAVTPQNEPEFPAPWEACSYNASFQSHFINNYFGPIMKYDHPNVKILAFDHNKDHLEAWTKEIIGKDKRGYVDGMAFHWYGGLDRFTDGTYGYEAVKAAYEFAPDKLLLSTEGCSCPGVWLNNWLRAERLGHDILYDLMNFAQGWIDWNLLLDETGGPNHLGNVCDASLLAMDDHTRLHVQPKYFYFAHFSKFLLPGSRRVANTAVGNFNYEMMDPNIQRNMEITLYPCEKSTRQMWLLNTNIDDSISASGKLQEGESLEEASKLRMFAAMNAGEARDSGAQRLCIGYGDNNRGVLRLLDCDSEDETEMASLLHIRVRLIPDNRDLNDMVFAEHQDSSDEDAINAGASSSIVQLQLQDIRTEQCITATQSSTGALFQLLPCETLPEPFAAPSMVPSEAPSSVNVTTSEQHGSNEETVNGKNEDIEIKEDGKEVEEDKIDGTRRLAKERYQFHNRGNLASILTLQHQVFRYDLTTHELTLPAASIIVSLEEGKENDQQRGMCVTAGWPFFNAVAFKVPTDFDAVAAYTRQKDVNKFGVPTKSSSNDIDGTSKSKEQNNTDTASNSDSRTAPQKWRTVIVAMNEASVSLPVTLYDHSRQEEFLYAISPRSIQTILYEDAPSEI